MGLGTYPGATVHRAHANVGVDLRHGGVFLQCEKWSTYALVPPIVNIKPKITIISSFN